VDHPAWQVRPLGVDDLADLASMFDASRNTRSCWCTSFCSTRTQFAFGWVTRRNRSRFEAMASAGGPPMGVLASLDGTAVGWAACGPRARYLVAADGRSGLLKELDRDEDERVWLVPCLFVRAEDRGQGVTQALVRGAVELAEQHGATAVEGWPMSTAEPGRADDFVGREVVFEQMGFRCVSRPDPTRAIMRLDLGGRGTCCVR
jgi:GNAT superfamily N-acetyltransferase